MKPPQRVRNVTMARPSGQPTPGGYGIYLLYAEAMLIDAGHDGAAWFRSAGLGDQFALQRGQRVPAEVLVRVLTPISREPALADFFLRLGECVPVAAHGTIGMAMQASRDLVQVLELVCAYAPLLIPAVTLALELDGNEARLRIVAASGHADFDRVLVESVASTLASHLPGLVGQSLKPLSARFTWAEPAHAEQYRRYFGPRCRFGAPDNRIVYPRQLFELSLPTADPVNFRFLHRQCELELTQAVTRQSWGERVRSVLRANLRGDPSLAFVAKQLACPERSLRRRLELDGCTFRALLAEVRLARARELLGDSELRIEQVAEQLGYRDPGCFRRAFRSETGLSPRAWRAASRT